MILSSFLGVLIGVVIGLTGAGGGVLAVPALVVGAGWSMQQAAPVALIAVAGSSALGAIEGLHKRLVRYKAATVIVCCGLPFAYLGIKTAKFVPQKFLMLLFIGVLVIVAVRLIRRTMSAQQEASESALAKINPNTGRFHWNWNTGFVFATIGGLAGFMTGLLGVGGGFIIVPALMRFTDLSMHGIVATSLMIVAMVGAGSVGIAAIHGAEFPMPATLLFALAIAVGTGIGRTLASRVQGKTIQRGFAIVLMFAVTSLVAKLFLTA